MVHKLVFDPALAVDPHAFAATWNSDPQSSRQAEAALAQPATKSFDPWLSDLFVILTGIGIGVAGNAFYDLIKKTLLAHHPDGAGHQRYERLTYAEIPQPDGTTVILVQIEQSSVDS